MALHIGCGSWADSEYVGVLYPPGLPATQRLAGYAKHFNHVEVNSSYYATPKAAVTKKWVKQTPDGFTFNIKLHRAFSRSPQKTAANGGLVDLLLRGVEPLIQSQRLGVFLLVLAPDFTPARHQLTELDELVHRLKPHVLAVELRHSDWVNAKNRATTLEYFKRAGIAWVAVDMPQIPGATLMPPVDAVTRPDVAYLRLHGRNRRYTEAESAAERHTYQYPPRELHELVRRVKQLAASAAHVHVIANNHAADFAPKTALALKRLLADSEVVNSGVRDSLHASRDAATSYLSANTLSESKPKPGTNMAKSQNSKKETKKAPQKTAKEKKLAKREKKG
jgi:uncharacterized protein YecE (DUF72 family)